MKTQAERDALARLSGGAPLPEKINVVGAVVQVLRLRHRDGMPAALWAALNVAEEKLAEAEFLAMRWARDSAGKIEAPGDGQKKCPGS